MGVLLNRTVGNELQESRPVPICEKLKTTLDLEPLLTDYYLAKLIITTNNNTHKHKKNEEDCLV